MQDGTLPPLTHADPARGAHMVDVGEKTPSDREAVAEAVVRFSDARLITTLNEHAAKGDPLETARLAGIMAAKRTAELIPLCHPLPLDHVDVTCSAEPGLPGVRITATARTHARTGVEMEVLTAAAVAGLTVIDMLKAADCWMQLDGVRLLRKSGGRSGALERPPDARAG